MKNANLVSLVLLAVVAMSGPGCERAGSPTTSTAARPKTVADWFPIKVGEHVVRMQLAVLPYEMQRGLMHRRDLEPDQGMLFVFRAPQEMSFWMRNTPTPLDIGYFSPGGELQEVYPLHPFDEESVKSRSNQLQFALEMNQGWFREKGVKPGAKLDLKAVAAALKERGLEPGAFSLAPRDAAQR